MKVNLTLIGGILAVATFFIFLFEIAILIDSFIHIHMK